MRRFWHQLPPQRGSAEVPELLGDWRLPGL